MVTAQKLGFKEGEATVYESQRYLDAAPKIKAAGEIAAGTGYVLRKRLAELKTFAQKYEGKKWTKENFENECPWTAFFYNTSTGALATPHLIVIQHNSPPLAAVTPQITVYNGGLQSDGFLEGGNIKIYSGDVLKQLKTDGLLNTHLREDQVVKGDAIHPIWLGYANGDRDLIQQLVPLLFKALCDVYNQKEGMGTYFSEDNEANVVRPVVLYWAVDGAYACAGGLSGVLRVNDVRLVGVVQGKEAPEGCRAERAQLENDSERGGAPLEALVGKGRDVGNGLIVVRRDQINDEVYRALTKTQ